MTPETLEKVNKVSRLTKVPFTGKTEAGALRYLQRFSYMDAKVKHLRKPLSEPSEKQLKLVKHLEDQGSPKFTGKTMIAASCYIETYNTNELNMTEKQRNSVKMCENLCGVTFTGTTYQELNTFLNTYMQRVSKIIDENRKAKEEEENAQ